MSNLIHIDKEYRLWIQSLSQRFRRSQIKASVRVNQEMLRFYWELGSEIVAIKVEERWGESVMQSISQDLKDSLPGISGLSPTNLYYCKKWFLTYSQEFINLQQRVVKNDEGSSMQNLQQPVVKIENTYTDEILQQPVATIQEAAISEANALFSSNDQILQQLVTEFFSIPWSHHIRIIDKCQKNGAKALFYVHQTYQNGWSRDVLLNFLDTDLYERSGKAITNFSATMPAVDSDLAQQLTKDPYQFDFFKLKDRYKENELKDELIKNIEKFLLELGRGFAYMGREFRLEVDGEEMFIDMLFYNVPLHRYVVVEIKTGKLESANVGQLGGYVVAVNHILNTPQDNPAIGLLICKEKNDILAQYALESSSQPLGISEYQLAKLIPDDFRGTMPTIEEIENELNETKD